MKRFVAGESRSQATLFPELLDDFVTEDNPVRAIEAFVDALDLKQLGFNGVDPHATGRPAYHPAILLKIYLYGYLNCIQSSRRLEREAQRNVELMWLTERLAPDFKTIADFRKNNGKAIQATCRDFVMICRRLGLFSHSVMAIDGSKFKAVNNRDRNFTLAKMKRRAEEIDKSIAEYDLVRKMRASVLILGPLLARKREASVSLPGGCAIGARPIDMHINALQELGAEFSLDQG